MTFREEIVNYFNAWLLVGQASVDYLTSTCIQAKLTEWPWTKNDKKSLGRKYIIRRLKIKSGGGFDQVKF